MRSHGGNLQVRALFEAGLPENAGYSTPVKATVDRFIGGTSDATAPIGPGSVDLLTGNYTISLSAASAASLASETDLTVSPGGLTVAVLVPS